MRRILITDFVRNVADEYAKDIKRFNAKNRLNELISLIERQSESDDYVTYVRNIIDNYDEIIVAIPHKLKEYNPNNRLILTKKFSITTKDEDGNETSKNISFHELVVNALGYNLIRNHSYPKFISKIGIRTCVYCNAQYGVSFKKEKKSKEFTSSYQIDHFLPKSKYPYLATSFFNLQPSCGHCNQMKSRNNSLFCLYTEHENELSPFKFRLEESSILRFLLTCDCSDLQILFNTNDIRNQKLLENHEKRFHVSLKYENHKEEAADIVLMSRFYNKAYLQQLQSQFKSVLPHFHRQFLNVLLGFPIDEKDIHKRPLTLLRQDLAKQLNLL